jgi:hypothetical protein
MANDTGEKAALVIFIRLNYIETCGQGTDCEEVPLKPQWTDKNTGFPSGPESAILRTYKEHRRRP